MEAHEIIAYLFIGLVVLLIVVFSTQSLIASELPQNISKELTGKLALTLVNNVPGSATGPAHVDYPVIVGSSYFYNSIRVTPQLKVSGERTSSIDMIAIIKFKEQSVRAVFNDNGVENGVFTIGPDDDFIFPVLTAKIATEIPPLTVFNGLYSGDLRQNFRVVVKSSTSSIIVYPKDVSRNYLEAAFSKELPKCRVQFSFEAECTKRSGSYLRECTSDEPGACQEVVELCGGDAYVRISSLDCSQKSVDIEEIRFEGGREWHPGETVSVSFWLDTACTRNKNSFAELLLCPEDRLGGEYDLNAGILEA